MQNTSSLHLWRIGRNFVIVIAIYLRIDVVTKEILALFLFYKEQIKKVNETVFELLQ